MKTLLFVMAPSLLLTVALFTGCDQLATKTAQKEENKIEVNHADTLTFTAENFEELVLNSDKLVIVDFWAEWCGPCKLLTPTINELATQYKGQVVVGKLNVDDNKELAMKYRASSIPMILFIKDGEVVEQMVGLQPKENFEAAIDALIAP